MLTATEVGIGFRESSTELCANQRAPLVGGSSATNQCHAAKIRAYQVDYRRSSLTPVALSAAPIFRSARSDPLDRSFHISSHAKPVIGYQSAG